MIKVFGLQYTPQFTKDFTLLLLHCVQDLIHKHIQNYMRVLFYNILFKDINHEIKKNFGNLADNYELRPDFGMTDFELALINCKFQFNKI